MNNNGGSYFVLVILPAIAVEEEKLLYFFRQNGEITFNLEKCGVFPEEEARNICVDDSTNGTAMVPVHKVLNVSEQISAAGIDTRITVVRNNEENIKNLGLSAALEEWGRNR